MATQWGLGSSGFLAKPMAQVEAEIDAALQAGPLGAGAGTNPDGTIPLNTIAGQVKAFMTDAVAAMWDLLQAVYSSFDPAQTTGSSQDAVYSITGVEREQARFSTATVTCTGAPGTVLPAARVATVAVAGTRFDTAAQATIASVPAWTPSTSYAASARITNSGNVYQCTVAGTSAASGGPTGTTPSTAAAPAPIVDGTATWVFLGKGTGAVDVAATAEVAGALGAPSGTLTGIATPVSGWQGVVNVLDAVVGQSVESDAAFRVRREQELAVAGAATADALRAQLLKVNAGSTDPAHQPPTSVTVFANSADATDATGLPPHSVEAVVLGGTAQDIANAVWANVPAGIGTHGNTASTVTDAEGNAQTVNWTRPVAVPVYVTATVYYDPTRWPATGAAAAVAAAAESAVLTYGNTYPVGESVRASALSAAIFEGPQAVDATGAPVAPAPTGSPAAPGIVDVVLHVGTAPSPTGTLVTITSRQLAQFESAQVTVTALPETP